MKQLAYRTILSALTLSLLAFGEKVHAQNSAIYLSKVQTGYGNSTDTVATGGNIVWTFAIRNNSGGTLDGQANGFRIYSPSGASWTPPVIDTLDIAPGSGMGWKSRMNGGLFFEHFTTGFGADTMGIGSFAILSPGFEDGFDADAFTITIPFPGIDSSFGGGEICLDSSYYFLNQWLWSIRTVGTRFPDWSGPHCYAIVSTCCFGNRGDLNNDGSSATILDLTYLIDVIYRGGIATCSQVADLDGDGQSGRVLDLTYLVDAMFRGGPSMLSCQ